MPTPIALFANSEGTLSFDASPGSPGVAFELQDGYWVAPGPSGLPAVFSSPGEPGMSVSLAISRGVLRQVPKDRERAWHEDIGERIATSTFPFIVALLAQRPDDMSATGVIFGGTGFLVKTDRSQFLVTAEHVLRGVTEAGIPIALGDTAKNISQWKAID